ncbi:DUF4245 domain-containing protein [Saccharopolyspora rectivirgula]|uniref:DUF4245 domain-containing protein n=1 Tax=Saccharopolyspora rectivirgula TaxID=28042 RepID=UPI0038B66533
MAQPRNQQPGQTRPPRTASAMIFAILPMVLIALGMAGLFTQCSFNPGGPAINPETAPTVDAAAELRRAADRVDFPVVDPEVPAGWRANSANVETLASQHRVVRTGWLTGTGHYLRLAQSDAAEEDFVAAETQQSPHGLGTVEAGGLEWIVYASVRDEQAWVTPHNGALLLITGDGTEQEFRALAEAVGSAQPVR